MSDGSILSADLAFTVGDPVEPSPTGVFRMGFPPIQRGVVMGMVRRGERVLVLVHWDGFAAGLVAQVEPECIQSRREKHPLL